MFKEIEKNSFTSSSKVKKYQKKGAIQIFSLEQEIDLSIAPFFFQKLVSIIY
jgi:hypothetical protein